ncbi:hypothetical protein M0D21_17220 [Aquimarina sp. D1M17]|uniref:polysialyltransferase family glycosyltransferase n=1 Tax=Aquimarina acroporae TaxID=2937283 RepID=UPI0020BD7FCD|nr:polysialyltransferase family glycosyltransferase [Aquimarina acroporae]MCK8523325.1 hypothetical protein [Aquimarina acroporae]
MRKNLFIAISPSHTSNFESIIKNKLHSGINVLLNPGNFRYDENSWDLVINGGMDLTYTVSSKIGKILFQIKKLKGYKKYLKKVQKQLSLDQNYTFFYCNLDDVVTNHIFLNLKKREDNLFYVVEDGILNYYYPVRDLKTLGFKKKLSAFCGLNFETFPGHPTNIASKDIKGQYVRIPNNAIYSEKSLALPYEKLAYSPKEDKTLIIGQDIMHNSAEGEEYYKERLSLLFEKVKDRISDNTTIIYKPHRNGDVSIAEELLNDSFDKYELFRDNTPIETCIPQIAPTGIYSFESSAMLNLKIAMDMKEVYFGVLPFSNNSNNVLDLYKGLGINILK